MKKFIECLIPDSRCNLSCSYCYIAQQKRKSDRCEFNYSPDCIGRALSKERLQGLSYISICSSGETLLSEEITPIVYNILRQGHFVNITTNGTISSRFKEIADTLPRNYLKQLHFSFSFHYLELLRTNNLYVFFKNIELVREAGCSFTVQVNLCDEYMPHWEDIKKITKKYTGAYSQVALTRNDKAKKRAILTKKTKEEYVSIGRETNSPLFDFTVKNFMVKRCEFCYAGEWSGKLDLATGILTSCYGYGIKQNIFKNINKPIKFEAIGKNCPFDFCFNSSHFMSLGIIPSISTPSYAELRDRREANWYSDEMREFLSKRLIDDNKEYSPSQKIFINKKYKLLNPIESLKKIIWNVLKKKLKR